MIPKNECREFECALTKTCIMYPAGHCKACYTKQCQICLMKYTCKKAKEKKKK